MKICTKKTIKLILTISIIALVVHIAYSIYFVATFHGDVYGKAEAYVIDIGTFENRKYTTSSDIIDLLYKFQTLHPQYKLMATDSAGKLYHNFSEKIENRADQYIVMFYFEDIDMIFCCVTEVTKRNNPLIKLFWVNKGAIIRNPKEINNYEEISRKENKAMKEKFETEILDSLGVEWRHKMFWD